MGGDILNESIKRGLKGHEAKKEQERLLEVAVEEAFNSLKPLRVELESFFIELMGYGFEFKAEPTFFPYISFPDGSNRSKKNIPVDPLLLLEADIGTDAEKKELLFVRGFNWCINLRTKEIFVQLTKSKVGVLIYVFTNEEKGKKGDELEFYVSVEAFKNVISAKIETHVFSSGLP